MNEIIKAIKERRSIKKYKSDMIPCEIIDQIVEAGLYAASGMGKQSTKVIVVANKEIRNQISESNRMIGGWKEGFDPFYGAPVILIVIGETESTNHMYDGSLVLGNLMLAAHSLGIGSCWINRAKEEFEQESGKKLLDKLGIEGNWSGIGFCALGYAENQNMITVPRKENRVYYID